MKKSHLTLRQQLNTGTVAMGLKTATMIVAAIIIFYQDLTIIISNALHSEITNYMLAVPFILAYSIYRKRKMLRAMVLIENRNHLKHITHVPIIAGLLLCIAAITHYWYSSYTFTPLEHHMAVLPIFVAGLILILFNSQTLRQAAFPTAFLIFLTPPPAEILYALGLTLSAVSSEAAYNIVRALGIQATISSEYGSPVVTITRSDGSTIPFMVDIACSGIYELIGFVVFATFLAYIARDTFWKKAATFLIGLPLICALNIIRIAVILLIGHYHGEQLALEIFHIFGGWILIVLGALLILTLSDKLFKTEIFTKTTPPKPCPTCGSINIENPDIEENYCLSCGRLLKYPKAEVRKEDMAKIVAIAFAVLLLLSIQVPVFALTEGPAQILIETPTGEQGNTQILPKIEGYEPKFLYRDREFEQAAEQDAALDYVYMSTDGNRQSVYVVVEIASQKSSLHRWEVCLITWPLTHGYQPKVTQLDLRDVQILDNPPVIARYFAFQDSETNQTEVILYWFETATFKANGTAQQKHVKIGLIAYANSPNQIQTVEERLLPFAKAIANHWQPIKLWTPIALSIAQNGPALTAATAALLVVLLFFQLFQKLREEKANLKLFNKLGFTEEEKKILQIVSQTMRKGESTADKIAMQYEKITGKPISHETVIEKLKEAEKLGITKRTISSNRDQPTFIWKNNIKI